MFDDHAHLNWILEHDDVIVMQKTLFVAEITKQCDVRQYFLTDIFESCEKGLKCMYDM